MSLNKNYITDQYIHMIKPVERKKKWKKKAHTKKIKPDYSIQNQQTEQIN